MDKVLERNHALAKLPDGTCKLLKASSWYDVLCWAHQRGATQVMDEAGTVWAIENGKAKATGTTSTPDKFRGLAAKPRKVMRISDDGPQPGKVTVARIM